MMYNDPNCKPWNSRTWAPEGFSSRDDIVAQDRANLARKAPEGIEESRTEKVGLNRASGGADGYHHDQNGSDRGPSMDAAPMRA